MMLPCSNCDKEKTEHRISVSDSDEWPKVPSVTVEVTATCEECGWPTHFGSDRVTLYEE